MMVALLVAGLATAGTRGLEPVHSATPVDSGGAYRRQVAVVVGIGDYPDDTLDLDYAVADARGVADLLRTRFGYDDVIELYDEQASRAAVLSTLSQLSSLHPDDALFVFWAGHGISTPTPGGESIGYLVPRDGTTDIATAAAHNISMDDLRTLIGLNVPARHRFLVVDACYGGLLATRSTPRVPDADAQWLVRNQQRDTFQILTAGQDDETVLDVGPDGHSVFTARLLETLSDSDGYLTATELAVQTQRAVRADAWMRGGHVQTPAFGRLVGSADFVLAPTTTPLPELQVGPRRSRTLGWTALGTLVLGSAGLATAHLTRNQYVDASLDAGPRPELVRWNRVSGTVGLTALGASGVLMTSAMWVGEW